MSEQMMVNDNLLFDITKILYTEMEDNFNQNFIGDSEKLTNFRSAYIEPLYPTKRSEEDPVHNIISQSSQSNLSKSQILPTLRNTMQMPQFNQTQDASNAVQYNIAIKKYSFKELCLQLGIGNFLCFKSSPPDPVYQDLGLGICLYLKFMKHLVYTLIFLAIFPIMQITFFYSISAANNFQPQSNYQNTLFSMTIGTLTLQGIKCIHKPLQSTKTYSFSLTCPIGAVRIIGPVYSNSNTPSTRVCKEDINLYLAKGGNFIQSSSYTYDTTCNLNQPNCIYNLNIQQQSSQFSYLSVTYECINGKSSYGSVDISRNTALICTVIFDLTFIIGMIMFYWSETHAEGKQQQWFKSKQLLLDQFSVQVGYFSKRNFQSQFRKFLNDLKASMQLSGISKDFFKNIVQVRLPDNKELKQMEAKSMKIYSKLYNLIGKTFLAKKINPYRYVDAEDFKKYAFKKGKLFTKYKLKLAKLLNKYIANQNKQFQNEEETLSIIIVFSKPRYKRFILQSSKYIRGKRYLKIFEQDEKSYLIKKIPAPSLILWENADKGYFWLRNIFSWTITILILAATYLLIAFMLWQRNKLLSNYNFNIQCNILYPGQTFPAWNQTLADENLQTYTHCFCLSKSVLLSINNEPQCKAWAKDYSLYLFIPIIFSVVIVVINAIVSTIYKALSKFQAHQYLATQLYSYIIKKTVLLVLNLFLIIIVLSIDTGGGTHSSSDLSFIYQGIYNDLTADWYLQVGLIITLSMTFNLLSPFVDSLVYIIGAIVRNILLYFFNKKDAYSKTKEAYISFYRDQKFPIEERYALVLAVLCITLCLNCVFPIMTIILLLTMFLLQINDKILIIKGFQKPVNYGSQLHSKFMKSFIVILLLHLICTAIFITEPFLLAAGDVTLEGSILTVNHNRIQALFNTSYAMPYIIIFVLIIVTLVISAISAIYQKTKPNERMYLGLDGLPYQEHKFIQLLNNYQLQRTIWITKKQLQKIKILDKKKKKHQNGVQPSIATEQFVDSSINLYTNQNLENQEKQQDNFKFQKGNILEKIAKFNLRKLQNRKAKKIKDKQRVVKLTGMTVYDQFQKWVFFNEHPNVTYKIKSLDQLLKSTLPNDEFIN